MIRSIKRNIARQRMKNEGYTQLNRGTFARLWRKFINATKLPKARSIHGKRKAV